ncbi:hypothetical protein [Diaphorobacter ruginosibacter]|uniref:hypothetical protein n=1 Tax=Diaphorobacter ruginosibacter TaxID=1715720 RepID=UPI003340ED05
MKQTVNAKVLTMSTDHARRVVCALSTVRTLASDVTLFDVLTIDEPSFWIGFHDQGFPCF